MLTKLLYYIRQYFGFSRGQTYGTAVLLFLLVLALATPSIVQHYEVHQQKKQIIVQSKDLDEWVAVLRQHSKKDGPKTGGELENKAIYLNINKASISALQQIYGIGPVRAKRILAYRDLLGGFVSLNQYEEIYNLPSEVVTQLKTHTFIHPDFSPQKININKASLQDLTSHPYLNYHEASALSARSRC
ncbi:MAG: helix-hairpin-helix domain-containing protein, partial [Bacteroidota bacterium]